MKKETKSSHAFRSRNIKGIVHPSFPGEGNEQPAHLGSQSAAPMQGGNEPDYMNQSLAPSQDMSFGMGAAAGS